MTEEQKRTSGQQPYGGSFGSWFFGWYLVGLLLSVVVIVSIVVLCNRKVARDAAQRDADWAAQHRSN